MANIVQICSESRHFRPLFPEILKPTRTCFAQNFIKLVCNLVYNFFPHRQTKPADASPYDKKRMLSGTTQKLLWGVRKHKAAVITTANTTKGLFVMWWDKCKFNGWGASPYTTSIWIYSATDVHFTKSCKPCLGIKTQGLCFHRKNFDFYKVEGWRFTPLLSCPQGNGPICPISVNTPSISPDHEHQQDKRKKRSSFRKCGDILAGNVPPLWSKSVRTRMKVMGEAWHGAKMKYLVVAASWSAQISSKKQQPVLYC